MHRTRGAIGHMVGVFLALSGMLLASVAAAQSRAGEFDHYVLALTWMPAFCATGGRGPDDDRCAPGARHGWMLHGLWPQHRGGTWPEYCATIHSPPGRRETAAQVPLFGHSGAAWHQWNKHGRCTGMSAQDYYALSQLAMERLTLPAVFARIESPLQTAPAEIARTFAEANPQVPVEAMVTTCRDGLLTELRICLTRDLLPRPCDPEMRACTRRQTRLLPLR